MLSQFLTLCCVLFLYLTGDKGVRLTSLHHSLTLALTLGGGHYPLNESTLMHQFCVRMYDLVARELPLDPSVRS